jgi:hypothetical protein
MEQAAKKKLLEQEMTAKESETLNGTGQKHISELD